jgi:hypothetical protein
MKTFSKFGRAFYGAFISWRIFLSRVYVDRHACDWTSMKSKCQHYIPEVRTSRRRDTGPDTVAKENHHELNHHRENHQQRHHHERRTVMNAYLRCGAIAIALLGSGGLAAAQQTFPRGAAGSNDNVIVAPADRASTESLNESPAAAPSSATPARKHKSKHAGTTHKHSGT